jgi:hypothetical protein
MLKLHGRPGPKVSQAHRDGKYGHQTDEQVKAATEKIWQQWQQQDEDEREGEGQNRQQKEQQEEQEEPLALTPEVADVVAAYERLWKMTPAGAQQLCLD